MLDSNRRGDAILATRKASSTDSRSGGDGLEWVPEFRTQLLWRPRHEQHEEKDYAKVCD